MNDTKSATTLLLFLGQGDDEFCLNFGSSADPCRDDCDRSGERYFGTYSLSDIVPVGQHDTSRKVYSLCRNNKNNFSALENIF